MKKDKSKKKIGKVTFFLSKEGRNVEFSPSDSVIVSVFFEVGWLVIFFVNADNFCLLKKRGEGKEVLFS